MCRMASIRLAAIIMLGMLVGGLNSPLQAFTLTISPSRLEYQVEPGQMVESTVKVTGVFDQPTRIRVRASDWLLDADGGLSLRPVGQQSRSLARWITVAPAEFVLGTGKVQAVRCRLQVPADITGCYWGALIFQTIPNINADQGAVGIIPSAGVSTIVLAETRRGAVYDGRISEVAANWSDGLLAMSVTFANQGTMMVRLKGRFEIRDKSSAMLAKIPFTQSDIKVLPDSTRRIRGDWKGTLKSGNYVLLAIVDFGGKNVIAGQRSFKVAE